MKMSEAMRRMAVHFNEAKEQADVELRRPSPPTEDEIRACSSAALRKVLEAVEQPPVAAGGRESEPQPGLVADRPEENAARVRQAHCANYPPGFHEGLLNDFFPVLHETVRTRMRNNPIAKLALGGIFEGVLKGREPRSAFFECGSTVALAVLALRMTSHGRVIDRNLELWTNSALVQYALCSLGNANPRLLYGNKWLNVDKYLGYFPIQSATIEAAAGSNTARDEVQEAWKQMSRDGAGFDVSFLTASRFHFVAGPFVGSPDNGFLKYAFYSSARHLVVLIDGSKLLPSDALPTEWMKECRCSFMANLADGFLVDFVRALFPDADARRQEELMQAIELSAHRNPQTYIRFPSVYVPKLKDERAANSPGHDAKEEIRAVTSWSKCVEQVMSRHGGGQVTICIAQPDIPSDDFEQRLNDCKIDANRFFMVINSRLRVGEPRQSVVFVHPETRTLREAGNTENCIRVPVWSFTYQAAPRCEQLLDPLEPIPVLVEV